MRLTVQSQGDLTRTLARTFAQVLDPVASRAQDAPVALAVSGGGDSTALLHLAHDWARTRRRRLLVLSVDHGLQPQSAAWSRLACEAGRRLGCDALTLRWDETGAGPGVAARARRARHALIACAARRAGARLVLFGHTADDRDEEALMRRAGVPLGRLRTLGPSPVWPEGRGLLILRPLLTLRRADLRLWLHGRGAAWIDDPANLDAERLRIRARLGRLGPPPAMPASNDSALGLGDARVCGAGRISIGLSSLDGDDGSRRLAMALASAAGREGAVPTRRARELRDRLVAGLTCATLGGAKARLSGDRIEIYRECGEFGRRPPTLRDGVFDGRFEVEAGPGERVEPVSGSARRLSQADKRRLLVFDAPLRPGLPLLFRAGVAAPVLAWPAVTVTSLTAERFALACGAVQSEDEIGRRRMAPDDRLS